MTPEPGSAFEEVNIEPHSRAAVVLRVLRRTVIGEPDPTAMLDKLSREVQPSSEDLVDALVEAAQWSDADPAKGRIVDLLGMALDARGRREA